VGEFVGHDAAGLHFLQMVVADGGSGVHCGFDVALLEEVALFGGIGPDSGVAIGLELDADGDGVGHFRIVFDFLADFSLDARDFLHVVADLVSNYVGLREFAGSAELIFEFGEEAEVEIDLFVTGTVKGAGGGLGEATGGIDSAAIEDQFCVTVLRDDFRPGVLHVIEDERDELDFALFGGALRGAGGRALRGLRGGGATQERREQIAFENETQDQQDQYAADADVDAAGETSAAAAGTVVFDIVADSAWGPTHVNLLATFAASDQSTIR